MSSTLIGLRTRVLSSHHAVGLCVVRLCIGRVLQLSPRTRVLSCHHAMTLTSSLFCLRIYVRLRAPLVQDEKTALCFAAMMNCKLSLAMLMEKGADIDAADNVRTLCFV
jgi:hypothetical protein